MDSPDTKPQPLTFAQVERIAKLMEECGEIIQVGGKIIAHGYDSFHPDNPSFTNLEHLMKELGDLEGVVELMVQGHDIMRGPIRIASVKKIANLRRWMHHQAPLHFAAAEEMLEHRRDHLCTDR